MPCALAQVTQHARCLHFHPTRHPTPQLPTTHRLDADDGVQVIKGLKGGVCPRKVLVDGLLDDGDGVVRLLVQIGPDLFVNIFGDVVGGVGRHDLCARENRRAWGPQTVAGNVHYVS